MICPFCNKEEITADHNGTYHCPNMNCLEVFEVNTNLRRQLISYTKGRAFMYVWGTTIPFILIDFLHWKYWMYAVIFIPVNFILNFFVYRKVFNNRR